jgi:hypothetical protein
MREDGGITIPSLANKTVVLGHALLRDRPGSPRAKALQARQKECMVIDQLLVDRALPAAVHQVVSGRSERERVRSSIEYAKQGVPVRAPEGIVRGNEDVIGFIDVEAPRGSFFMPIEKPTIERLPGGHFEVGSHVLVTPSDPEDFVESGEDRFPRLILSENQAFNATGARWTIGRPFLKSRKPPLVSIGYVSYVAPRQETVKAADVIIAGRITGVYSSGLLKHLGGA